MISLWTDKGVVFAFTLFFVSLVIFHFQRELGPRLFFIACFKGGRPFDYFVKVDEQAELDDSDCCAICYSEFKQEVKLDHANDIPELSDSMHAFLSANWQMIMKTPCGHYFHISCLLTVMNYRQVCPICRAELPPVEA